MAVATVIQHKPNRLLRIVFRVPVYLYLLDLGWLLGHRFLMVTHRGRKSGLLRRTVLEVLQHDRETVTSIVMAAYGERADWLRNIQHSPPLEVQIGGRRYVPEYHVLSDDEARHFLKTWEREHPLEAAIGSRVISGQAGQWGDVKVVSFRPTTAAS